MTIDELRERYGLSQYDLASITGIAQPNIAAMERGTRRVTDAMMNRITTAVEQWLASREEAAERAVRAAFEKPHLRAMRARWSEQ